MTNKELFYFVGKCLMLDEDPDFKEVLVGKIEEDLIDWLKFSAFCSNHLILPVIHLKFKNHGITDYLPGDFSEYLNYIYDLNKSRNTQILDQCKSITEILNKNDIYPVFLKGAGNLLDGLYTDIGERMMSDIDFLVSESDYLLSAKLLKESGYRTTKPSYYLDVANLTHYPKLSNPNYPAVIEIHQKITENHLSWFNPAIINREKKEVITLRGCAVLSYKHQIIYNFFHCQFSHDAIIDGIISFRDLYDLYLLSKKFDLYNTLTEIKRRRNAIAYFMFADKAFGLSGSLFHQDRNFYGWFFEKRHDLNLNSRLFYHVYRTIIYFGQKIFVRIIGQVIKSFYSKEMRMSMVKRLTHRQYYKDTVMAYFGFFVRKNLKGD